LPIYWHRKIGDLQLELRSSNPSQGEKTFCINFTTSTSLSAKKSTRLLFFSQCFRCNRSPALRAYAPYKF